MKKKDSSQLLSIRKKSSGSRKSHSRMKKKKEDSKSVDETVEKNTNPTESPLLITGTPRPTTLPSTPSPVTKVILEWNCRTLVRLVACRLRGINRCTFQDFNCLVCGTAVPCNRKDNFIHLLRSHACRHRLFSLQPHGHESSLHGFLDFINKSESCCYYNDCNKLKSAAMITLLDHEQILIASDRVPSCDTKLRYYLR